MKLNLASSLAGVAVALSLSVSAQTAPLDIGVVFDLAGKYDHAINQAVSAGLDRAEVDFGVRISSTTPLDAADALRALREAASSNQLVLSVGHLSAGPVSQLARLTPGVHYAVVDDLPQGVNTTGIRFRENEGAFIAGYLSGSDTSTSVVGVVAPPASPTTASFVAAFQAGVKLVCTGCVVLVGNVNSVDATASAEAISKGMLQRGADILFAAASSGKLGVIAAVRNRQCLRAADLPGGVRFSRDLFAKVTRGKDYKAQCGSQSRPVFFIGWESDYLSLGDTDADETTLNTGLAAIVKRADNAVYSLIRDVVKHRPWRTGENGFGFQNGGLEVTVNTFNAALIDPAMQARLTKVEQLIVNGSVKLR